MSLVDKAVASVPGKRAYEPIWDLLKDARIAQLIVVPKMVNRVKKAVMKEKYNDGIFKMMNGHQDLEFFYLSFEYDEASQLLTIRLNERYGVT